ncbi:MAG: DUF4097 family beta strand repeat-containing protein [Dictyoglomaceae bacterium]
MEEIRKILKMLEEGKITVEEAERLIEAAIKEKEKKRKTSFDFAGIGEIIKDSISSVFSFIPEIVERIEVKEDIEWSKEKPLILEITGGDVDIFTHEGNMIAVEGTGHYERIENTIKVAGGDFEIKIPNLLELKILVRAGDLEGKILAEKFTLKLDAGDADINLISKDINVSVKMGDLDLILENIPEEINIECKMGDVTLKLPEDFDGTIHPQIRFGDFSLHKPYKIEGKDYIIGTGEKCKIEIDCRMGDVKIY